MGCNYRETIREKLFKAIPDATEILLPIEVLSNKMYIEVTKIIVKNGKTKRLQVPITLSRCPFCGVECGEMEVVE